MRLSKYIYSCSDLLGIIPAGTCREYGCRLLNAMFSFASSRRRSLTVGDDRGGSWCLGTLVLIGRPSEVLEDAFSDVVVRPSEVLEGTFADVERIERAISFKACCRSFVCFGKITSCWSCCSRERCAVCRAAVHVVRQDIFAVAAGALDLTELATWESRYETGRTISCGYWVEEAIVKLKYVEYDNKMM